MWLARGPLATDALTRRFWWRFHGKEAFTAALAVALVGGVLVWALLGINEVEACNDRPFECNLITEVGGTLAVALGGALFFIWKLRAIVRDFATLARERPQALLGVEMPCPVAGEDAYRRELFTPIGRDLLHEQPSRAPGRHVGAQVEDGEFSDAPRTVPVPGKLVTAGAGAGKTTAMVRLTAFLAERQAVPVPVSLRGEESPINLIQLARDQFKERAETRTLFGDQGDRVFARLRARGQLVILADGLDEAVPGTSRSQREVVLTAAIREALDAKVAVVVTSRTAELGHQLPLAHFELPPLEDSDAIEFLSAGGNARGLEPDTTVDRRVKAAELRETPFYLTVARPLLRARRLHDWPEDKPMAMRVDLLDRYVDAICDKTLLQDVELLSERRSVIDELSDLACRMLRNGRASVSLTEVEERVKEPFGEHEKRPADAHTIVDGGSALELLEISHEAVQFKHSVMQAYLASRRIREQTDEVGSLVETTRSKELLIAVVMAGAWRGTDEPPKGIERRSRARRLANTLLTAASERQDRSALALVTAAAKIVATAEAGADLASDVIERADERWDHADASTRLDAIVPLADLGTEAACNLLRKALDDPDFQVKLAAATALGEAGETAYQCIRPEVNELLDRELRGETSASERRRLAKLGNVLPLFCRGQHNDYVAEVAKLLEVVEAGLKPADEGWIARGFKRDAWINSSRQVDLSEAKNLLIKSQWWYSKLCFMHALVLRTGRRDASEIQRLIASFDDRNEHAFVREAARQCVSAIDERDATAWIWSDEPDVVRHARASRVRTAIAEGSLRAEAVQLAADVALAINLTFSVPNESAVDIEERRTQHDERVGRWLDSKELPYCLERSRTRREIFPPDGTCPHTCHHKLCPSNGSNTFLMSEFSEAFCRQQRDAPPRRQQRPSWQRGFRRSRGLRSFWDAMAEEARWESTRRKPSAR